MAIGFIERAVDFDITTLGGLLNAGKLRFLEYYPGELDDQGDEESVAVVGHMRCAAGSQFVKNFAAKPAGALEFAGLIQNVDQPGRGAQCVRV